MNQEKFNKRIFWSAVALSVFLSIVAVYPHIFLPSNFQSWVLDIARFFSLWMLVVYLVKQKSISDYLKANPNILKRLIKLSQIVGFGGLLVFMLFAKYLSGNLAATILYIAIPCMGLSMSLRQELPRIETNNLEQKIKNDFNLITTTKHKKFPKFVSWVGGFVIPALPLFSIVNKNWKKNLNQEAIIHENVHLYYLQNGAILVYLLFIILAWMLYSNVAVTKELSLLFLLLTAVPAMTFFEYITFKTTYDYAQKLHIEARRWDKKIMLKYLVVYSIQMTAIYGIVKGLQYLWGIFVNNYAEVIRILMVV